MTATPVYPQTLPQCPECGKQNVAEAYSPDALARRQFWLGCIGVVALVVWPILSVFFYLMVSVLRAGGVGVLVALVLPPCIAFACHYRDRRQASTVNRAARGECLACGYDLKVPASSTSP